MVNGPRTAKHVTDAFLQYLPDAALQKTFFYDFRSDAPRSAEPVMATLLQNSQSIAFLPGESTSVISECLLDPKQVVIVRNNAMNQYHQSHVDIMRSTGYKVIHLEDNNFYTEPCDHEHTITQNAAADLIANKALQIFNNGVKKQVDTCIPRLLADS